MPHAPLARIAEHIEAPVEDLEPFARCDPADLERLDTMIATAFDAEDSAFTAALWSALRLVPRPLRGTARALLFPSGAS